MELQGDEPELLHVFFERSARAHPDRTALDIPAGPGREHVTLSYAELDRRAGALARRIAPFVTEDCVVAIFLPRHVADIFASEIAVLRAGAAYTCIDPAHPDPHAAYLIDDSRAVVLVTDAAGSKRAKSARFSVARVLDVAATDAEPAVSTNAPRTPWLRASSLAYVIYTSGTTGPPKGVMIEHASIANLVASDISTFRLTPADRIAQGSSHAYDSAIEETWLAFAAGATLVVLDDEIARAGPDLVPWLRDERITVFCPPPTLLRATGCRDPERELPLLRLLYVGGEALPREIADAWARGRWMENGYGPTECTVTVVRGRVEPGQPVAIGRAVRGNVAHVLDEELDPVAPGATGELCLSGKSLARGYLRRAELSREKFPLHARFGRMYRTGDLVRREPSGELVYLGRIDAQVKLRGHRIELEAVESMLATLPGVRAAACRLQDVDQDPILVAFVVPVSAESPPRLETLRETLRGLLPEYMVPRRFALLSSLPASVGGKLDRAALPKIAASERTSDERFVAARNALESTLARSFQRALGLEREPSIESDFFVDLGGDSLAAAVAVSIMREDPSSARLTVRDLYGARTVAGLARRVMESASERDASTAVPRAAPSAPHGTVSNAGALLANAFQISFLALELWIGAIVLHIGAFDVVPSALSALSVPLLLVLAPVFMLAARVAWIPVALAIVVLAKKVLIGTYRPLRTPVFSSFYVRNWIVQQIARIVPWRLIAATELQNVALRALGAKIGRRVHIHSGVALTAGGWDLLTIGDDVMVGTDAALRLVDLEAGELVVGPVTIGDASTVDVRAGLSAHSSLGARAFLTALSSLSAGEHVPDDESFDGVPARAAGRAPDAESHSGGPKLAPSTHAALIVLGRVAASMLFALPALTLLACLARANDVDRTSVELALTQGSWPALGLATISIAIVAAVPLTLALQALFLRALGPVPFASTSRFQPGYARIVIKSEVVNAAGDWLSGTLFWPIWLRLAGMRIGRNCEISTILDVVPECIEIGDECFLADGIYLGGPRLHRGVVTVACTRLARGSFLGNHAVIRAGDGLPEDVLVGVCTAPDASHMHAASATFGHPPFELARPLATAFDRGTTHEPSFVRRANRIAWEAARFLLPIPPLVLVLVGSSWLAARVRSVDSTPVAALRFALVALFVAAASVALVLALKWILLGRVRAGEHPLWSCWCSRWDFLYVAWAFWARGVLASFEGTLLLAWYLRAMGASIGRRVVLSGGFAHVVDPDMLVIEDGATVHALFQAHSFEDRVLKIDRVTIRAGADIGSGAVLFYGSEIGANTRVAPHSVVMKHERLLPGRAYTGCPVREV